MRASDHCFSSPQAVHGQTLSGLPSLDVAPAGFSTAQKVIDGILLLFGG